MNCIVGSTRRCPRRGPVCLKAALTLICTILLNTSSPAEVISFNDSWGTAGFNLVEQNDSGVEIVFSVPSFRITSIEADGEIMQMVSIPGVIAPRNAGAPNLPGVSRYIAIPEGATAELEIIQYRTETYHDFNIAPALPIKQIQDDSPDIFTKDPAIYTTDAYFPDQPALLSESRNMRGVDVVLLAIAPFQYNPVTGELRVTRDLKIRVHFAGGSGHFGEDRLRSRFWEPVLAGNLLNYSSLPKIHFDQRRATDEEDVEYLIIVPDDPAFIAWADTIKQWRNQQGIITGITTLSEIGGNNANLIEDYIDNAYRNWDPAPAAVLLMADYAPSGDPTGITAFRDSFPFDNISDNFYADVDEDALPDIAFARLTAQNDGHLATMIGKLLEYERTPPTDPGFYQHPISGGSWETDQIFILGTEVCWGFLHHELGKDPAREYAISFGTPGSIWSNNPNTWMMVDYFGPHGLGYIPNDPSYLTDWGGNATRIVNDINSGAFIAYHSDHGDVDGWVHPEFVIDDLYNLTNNEYPFFWSMNCLNGMFDVSGFCFAEAIHRMQHGALGIIAASDYSYNTVNVVYLWGMFDSLWPNFDPGYGSDPTGAANLRTCFAMASGKYYLEASNWPDTPQYKETTYYLYHHHGDAFTTLYSEVPQNLTVIHDNVMIGGMDQFTVTADEGSLIGLSVDGNWLAAADGTGGPVNLTFDPVAPGQMVRVTVTKANYYRYMADVDVIPPAGPWVTFEACEVADDLLGNNNGQLDFGETSHLTLTAENIGVEDATGVTLRIFSDDPLLTVLDSAEYVGDIPAGTMATADHGFSVELNAAVEDGHIIPMRLEAVSTATWESNFAITAHAPECEYTSHTIDDPTPGNQNGNLDPGEDGTITVTVTNAGSSTVPDLLVELTTTDPYVTLSTGSVNVGTIPPEGSAEVTYDVSVSASCPQEHLAAFELAFSGGGYSGGDGFDLTIGDILYSPTGPDTYGYLAYDPFDAPEQPVYDWVEICPDSGGSGTRVNFIEDEQVLYCLLPFTFRYYGLDYDTLSMGANGWIAPGRVTADDYSNSGIPNSDGPAAMIAPYWEDLSPQRTNSGGVWRWYDEIDHCFIVEYNHIEQYAPTGNFETFQVILFDPDYHPTATGDGKILFQYKAMSASAQSEGTVGIENHLENDGVEYLCDGDYDNHAHMIENEFAILFTTMMQVPELTVDLTYVSGSPVPATGGNLDFEVFVENIGSSAANFDAWLDVSYEGGAPTTIIQRYLAGFQPGWTIDRPDAWFPVPGTYAAGNYMFYGRVGDHPGTVWAEDGFPFVKSGTHDGSFFQPFIPAQSFPDPFAVVTGAEVSAIEVVPEEWALGQNYPNPFNPLTTISFALPEAAQVKLTVYNVHGQVVTELLNGMRPAGFHEISFDAAHLASGLYFYRIEADGFSAVRKMVLMK